MLIIVFVIGLAVFIGALPMGWTMLKEILEIRRINNEMSRM